MADGLSLDALPGFRRRILIAPQEGRCVVDLEDDYHRMSVTVTHREAIALTVEGVMDRVPWTTCTGARGQLAQTFGGRALAEFGPMGGKTGNCTHLFDLAQLAAAHALDDAPTMISILVSDPVEGRRHAELRRGGVTTLAWTIEEIVFVSPPTIAGLTLYGLRDWIDGLDAVGQEDARLLRWASMLSHGRTTDRALQDDPARLPRGTCFTFQEPQVDSAHRLEGTIRDFRPQDPQPLSGMSAFL